MTASQLLELIFETEAEILGLDEATFPQCAPDAKHNRPLSKALAPTEIHLVAAFDLKLTV